MTDCICLAWTQLGVGGVICLFKFPILFEQIKTVQRFNDKKEIQTFHHGYWQSKKKILTKTELFISVEKTCEMLITDLVSLLISQNS